MTGELGCRCGFCRCADDGRCSTVDGCVCLPACETDPGGAPSADVHELTVFEHGADRRKVSGRCSCGWEMGRWTFRPGAVTTAHRDHLTGQQSPRFEEVGQRGG